MKFVIRGLVNACLLWAVCNAAMGQTIEFNSLDRKQGYPALFGGRAQYTDKINGVFTRPAGTAGNVPVMVILHGSGGISDIGTGSWSRYFLSLGIATFVVDSFGLRGFASTAADQSQLTYTASTVDALMALQTVAKLPGVDAGRIGVIGFSRGGQSSTNSAYPKIRAAVLGADNDLRYSLHVALYGGCSQPGTTDKTPILFLMGDDDGYVTPETCLRFVDAVRSRGANIEFVVYPNTKHGFDQDRNDLHAAKAQTWKKCTARFIDLDNLTYSVDGKIVSSKEYADSMNACMTTGVTVGPNYPAQEDARARVKAFVLKNFGM